MCLDTHFGLLHVSIVFHEPSAIVNDVNKLNFSYNLRINNVFRRLGIPGPAPIPLLGEMFNVMRTVMNFINWFDYTHCLLLTLFRESITMT